MGFIPDYNADDHRKIIDFLNSKNKSDIADDLEELRKWRNMGDYYDIIKDQYDLRSMSAWAIVNYPQLKFAGFLLLTFRRSRSAE